MNNRRLYIFGILFIVAVLLVFSSIDESNETLIITNNNHRFIDLLNETDTDMQIVTSNGNIRDFTNKSSTVLFSHQAEPLISANENYSFTPYIIETVVIAIDRDLTDEDINSFSDLLTSDQPISFDFGGVVASNMYEYSITHHIVLSMSMALYGEYDLEAISKDFYTLESEGRFHYKNMKMPIIITYDSVAVSLAEEGRNLEIIIPTDGSYSFPYGILSYNNSYTLSAQLNDRLLDLNYRLIDGTVSSSHFPDDSQYQNAKYPEDISEFNHYSSLVSKTLRRDSFSTKRYGFANLKETTAAYLVLLFLLILYLISIIRRITERVTRNWLLNIIVLQVFFISQGLVKSIVNSDAFLEAVLWYSYYIPFLITPTIFLYISVISGNQKVSDFVRKFFIGYFGVAFALLLFVFTNDIHRMVFTVYDHLITDYDYNIGYYFVIGYVLITTVSAVVILIYKSFTSPKKWAFLLPVITTILTLINVYGFVTRIPFFRDSDVSFTTAITVVLFIEVSIQSRLFPSNKGYKRLFENSSLSMEIRDNQNNLVSTAAEPRAISKDIAIRNYNIPGGTFSYFEDYSTLNNALLKLEAVNIKLAENNQFLKQKGEVDAELSALIAERAAYKNIDNALNSGIKKITILTDRIRDGEDSHRIIALINIVVAAIKRECMLLINLLYNKNIEVNTFLNTIREMQEFTLGEKLNLTAGCTVFEDINGAISLKLYRVFYNFVLRALEIGCTDILSQLYRSEDKIIFSLTAERAITDDKFVETINEIIDDRIDVTIKTWDDTEVVLLSFEGGALSV